MNKIEKNTQKTRGFKASTAKIRLGVMILFSLFLVGFASAALTDDLISYYNLDESAGTVIDSLSLHNGTNTGGIADVSGLINTAYSFAAGTERISYGAVSDFDFTTGDFTIALWLYPISTGTGQFFLGNAQVGSEGPYLLDRLVSGNFHYYIAAPNAWTLNVDSGLSIVQDQWNFVVLRRDGSTFTPYVDGVMGTNGTTANDLSTIYSTRTFNIGSGFDNGIDGSIDEVGLWNRSLTQSEIIDLYNGGAGLSYPFVVPISLPQINLTSPENNSIITKSDYNFTTNLSITTGVATDWEWKNITYSVWDSDGDLFNETLKSGLSGNETNETQLIGGLTLGQYYWNSYACYSNATFGNCSWGDDGNYTFYLGASLNSLTYSNNTYETATENFFANFSVLESAEISLAQLVYNGTNYTITNLTQTGTSLLLQRSMDIPLNINGSANETKDFFFRFSYGGGVTQETSSYEQNVSFIKFIQCAAPYTRQSLNFTIYDEINQTDVPAVTENINIESNFKYWIGTGDIYKTYTFQNLSSTVGNYQFCIDPYFPDNYTFKVSSNIEYSADSYRENSYYMNNATLTNVSNDILLYTVHNDYATKFFLTFQRGTSFLGNAYVNVQKYFVGLDEYRTVAILNTDDNGDATMWQEVDKKYKYTLLDEDGIYIGTIYKTSICSVSPCALTLIIFDTIPSAFDIFNENYATGIVSNLSFSNDTKMVTYDFIDVTGLAHYFRLVVDNVKVGSGNTNVCDVYSYSAAGTLTCNVTGYEGDFIANTYISRSPEKLDKVISFLIADDILSKLGLNGVFIILILIITLTIAAAVMSRGNPSVVIFVFGIAVLALKLIGFLPFGWVTVAAMEVLIVWIMIKLKT